MTTRTFNLAPMLVAVFAAVATSFAQTTPAPPVAAAADPARLAAVISQLEQTAQTTSLDLAHLRIDKWKGERAFKDDAASKTESLEKNLTAALPAMAAAVRSTPTSMAPALKVYRNLNVVYDVLASLAESAGAFGSKDEFRALEADVQAFDSVRRDLADQLELMASAQDAELLRLRSQPRPASSSVRKIVVDDNEPAPRPVRKKKPQNSPPPATPKPQ